MKHKQKTASKPRLWLVLFAACSGFVLGWWTRPPVVEQPNAWFPIPRVVIHIEKCGH